MAIVTVAAAAGTMRHVAIFGVNTMPGNPAKNPAVALITS